jgi:hypothetical protein
MRLGYEEKPDQPEPEARSGMLAAVIIVLVLTALFVTLLRFLVGM